MSVAIRAATRIQDMDDANVTLGVGVDEYALVYDHDTAKFVLRAPVAAPDLSGYALLAGRLGGQTLYGGTAANDDITIHGTSDATRTTSYVLLQPTAGNVGIGTISPATALHVVGAATITGGIRPAADGTTALQLQNVAGTSILGIDTSNANVNVSPVIGSDLITVETVWSPTPASAYWTSTYNSVTASGSGSGSISPSPALTIVAGSTYLVTFTVSAVTGFIKVQLGGYPTTNSNYLLPGSYSAYFFAQSSANLIFSTSGATVSAAITDISVKKVSGGILSLGGGRIGTGTATPLYPLDVNGPIKITTSIQNEKVLTIIHGDGTEIGSISALRGGDSGYSGLNIGGVTNINKGVAASISVGRDSTGLSTLGFGYNSGANAYGTLFFGLNSATRRTLALTGASGLYGIIKIGDSAGSGDYNHPLVLQPVTGSVGIGTIAPTTILHVVSTTATTNAICNILTLGSNVTDTGVGAAGLGAGFLFQAESSTTVDTTQARIASAWIVATHATRTSRLALSAYDTAEREGIRIDSDGAAARLGFYAHAAVAQQVLPTGAGRTADDIITFLQNLGLAKQA